MIETKKILLITNIPNPYRIPLFNELNRHFYREGFLLKVIFGALGYGRRRWKIDLSECEFKYDVLHSRVFCFSDQEKTFFSYKGLFRVLKKENPYLVITTGFSFATLKLWLRSWFFRTKYIIWTGSVLKEGRFDTFFRKIQRKMLIKRAVDFIAYGTSAKEYLLSLGAEPNKIKIAINTVDVRFYENEVKNLNKNLVFPKERKHLLFLGYLSPRKNVMKVLEIVKELSQVRNDFLLDIVGDGHERLRLEKYMEENNLQDFVIFHGFKQKYEIPPFMANTDIFLFQTDFDIWGLVLNEAMAAGLLCIASIHAGATRDLIRNGKTGFAMDFSNTGKVVEKIIWIFNNPELKRKICLRAKRFILKEASLEKSVEGFIKAIQRI